MSSVIAFGGEIKQKLAIWLLGSALESCGTFSYSAFPAVGKGCLSIQPCVIVNLFVLPIKAAAISADCYAAWVIWALLSQTLWWQLHFHGFLQHTCRRTAVRRLQCYKTPQLEQIYGWKGQLHFKRTGIGHSWIAGMLPGAKRWVLLLGMQSNHSECLMWWWILL